MTVRLAQTIGIENIAQYAKKFGISEKLPPQLSISLGAGETTLLNLTTAYGMLVNGGKRIRPTLIDRIQDRAGKTVFKHDVRVCSNCQPDFWTDQSVPIVPDMRDVVTKPSSAFQMVSMLEGAVERGTGRGLRPWVSRWLARREPPMMPLTPGSWAFHRIWWWVSLSASIPPVAWKTGAGCKRCGTDF